MNSIDQETGEIRNGLALLNQAAQAIQPGTPLADLALTFIMAGTRALEQVTTVEDAKDLHDKELAFEEYLRKHGAELVHSNLSVALRLRTERKLGRMLGERIMNRGILLRGQVTEPRDNNVPTLAQHGTLSRMRVTGYLYRWH